MVYDFTKIELDYINKYANFNERQQEVFDRLTDKKGRQSIVKMFMEMHLSERTIIRTTKEIKKKIYKIL